MTLPREFVQNDQQLVRYLLGLLPEEEAEHLDEASIVDDEVARRLRLVENDLVDAYVSGTLDRWTLERFELSYLASPRRREKVRFAKRFLSAIDRTAAGGAPIPAPVPDSGEPVRHPSQRPDERLEPRWKFAWPLAVAALLLLACGALLFQDVRLRRELDWARSERAALNRTSGSEGLDGGRARLGQLDPGKDATAATTEQSDRDRPSAAAREPQPSTGVSSVVTAPATPVAPVALVLSPETRAPGPVVTIAVPVGADRVAFELRLESSDFERYQIALKDPGAGRIVWRSRIVGARSRRGVSFVPIVVPAGALESQHYSLALAGLGASGHAESVGSYAFEVDRR